MPQETLLDDIQAYIGFTEVDTEALRALRPHAAPHFERIAEHFYARIFAHPKAHEAIRGGQAQVHRLQRTLVAWMDSGLEGPHDQAFFERRARIGRVHVQIALPQHYMFTAMDVMRLDFREVVEGTYAGDAAARKRASAAVDKLFDMELAIMLETYREDSDARLRRRERLATIGQVAAGIGHDLRNPLGVIESSLYLLRKRTGDDERAGRHLDKIAGQVRVSNQIITDLLQLAREKEAVREPVDLAEVVAEAVEGAGLPGSITVETDVDARLLGDAGLLRQAVVNLLTNAGAVLGDAGGRVWVRARRLDDTAVTLSVEDDGPGFDPEALGDAFEPLVTTRAKGVGLGLALVRSIVERHGGIVTAENREEGGARIRLSLPSPPPRTQHPS